MGPTDQLHSATEADSSHDEAVTPPPPGEGDAVEREDAFAYFTLEGESFSAPGLPVSNAREAAAFRDAVIDLARAAWLRSHPTRIRVPFHFEQNLDLRLLAVEEGSSKLYLKLHRSSSQSDDEWGDLESSYATGRDDLTNALSVFAASGQLPLDFPPRALRSVRGLGATLEEDERLVLGSPHDTSSRVAIDRSVRDLLQRIDELLPPASPDTAELVGVLSEFDGHEGSFQIRTEMGLHRCRIEPDNAVVAGEIYRLLALDGVTAPDVKVTGETNDPTARRVQLINVREVKIQRSLAEKLLVEKLHALGLLNDGWAGPQTTAPAPAVLEMAEQLISAVATIGLEVAVVPSPDGNVVFEWRRGVVENTLSVEPGGQMFMHADNTETDAGHEYEGPFDNDLATSFLREGIVP